MEGFSVFSIVIGLVAILFVWRSIKMVPQGEQFTLERFGRYTQTLKPGLHFIIPFIERIGYRMNMREQVIDVPSQDVITRDNAMVTVDGIVFYQILEAVKAAYEVNNLEIALTNLTMTNIRTVMGSMDLDELLSHREKINAQLLVVIDEATEAWGVKVTRIEIMDIKPPKDLVDSMGRQMKAERDKRAEILMAEGERQSAILRAEGQKQAVILEAEAKKEAAFRESEARERRAEAEARATQVLSDAIVEGNMQAVNYFVAQNYIGALKDMASAQNHKVILMPLEASNVIGALGGIGEIAKEIFDKHQQKEEITLENDKKKSNTPIIKKSTYLGKK